MVISKDLKIEIRQIPNRNGIQDFSKNLEFFSKPHTIGPLVNPRTMRYDSGLTEEDYKYLEENNFPYQLKPDTYIEGQPHPFWESSMLKIELKSTPIFLYPGRNLLDFIKWKYLLQSKFVYNSEAEMNNGGLFEATHYIYNESEETTIKASRLEKRNALIREISQLTLARKREIILILNNEITENKNEDYLTVKLNEIIDDKDKSKQLKDLLSTNAEDISLLALIKVALYKNVLQRTKQGIYYFETNLGFSEEDVRKFLAETENQEVLISIKSKIK